MSTVKTAPPRNAAEKRELRNTFPRITRQCDLLQGGEWGDMPWDTAGLTWNVRHQFAPLGQTPAAIVTYRGRRDVPGKSEILQLPLQQVHARLWNGRIYYDDVRGEHELGFVAFPGAKGRILDANVAVNAASEPTLRRKNEWADIAIELLRQQYQFSGYCEPGDSVPQLPHIFAGFSKPGAASIAGSDAKRAVAAITGCSAMMSDGELQRLLPTVVNGRTVLESLCIAPGAAGNPTARWLVRQEYLAYINDYSPLYEDFTALCGVEVFNPARLAGRSLRMANPTRLAAAQAGIDIQQLLNDLDAIDATHHNVTDCRDAVASITEKVFGLLQPVRRLLGRLSSGFTDEAVIEAIMHPRRSLEQYYPTHLRTDAEKLDFGFGFMALQYPHLIGKITVDDMLQAFDRPYRPLYARHACIVQHIQLNGDGRAVYTEQQLQRRRLYMECC